MRWQWMVPDISHFVDDVDAGKARTRLTAAPERLAAAQRPFDHKQNPMQSGIGLIALMLLIAAATLVSEDLTCISAGLMIARGAIGFIPGALACLFGIYFGDLMLFWAGRIFGRAALKHRPLRWFINEEDVRRSTEWFNRRGAKIILMSRFCPEAVCRLISPPAFCAPTFGAFHYSFCSPPRSGRPCLSVSRRASVKRL